MRIFKYSISPGPNVIYMPTLTRILSVGNQDGVIQLWALVDESNRMIHRLVQVVGTGHLLADGMDKYIGTVVIDPYVWHAFDLGELP